MGMFRVFWRQVRADIATLLTLAAILLVSATVAAAFPRWLNNVDDEAIQYELREGQEIDDITIAYDGPNPSTRDAVDQLGTNFLGELESPLDSLAGAPVISARIRGDVLIERIDNNPRPEGNPPLFLTPRVLLTPDNALRYVEGGPPQEGELELVAVADEMVEERVIEVALSTATAEALNLAVGSVVVEILGGERIVLRIAGLFEPIDAESYIWKRNFDILSPTMVNGGIGGALGEAVVTDESLPTLTVTYGALERPPPVTTSYGYPLAVSRVVAADAVRILTASNRLQSQPLDTPTIGTAYRVQTSVQRSVERFLGQRATARAVGGVGAVGLLVAVIAVLALAAQMIAERRRAALALARARGGTLAQLASQAALEALTVSALAGAAGGALGTRLVDARPASASLWFVVLLVAAATIAATTIVAWEHRVVGRTERRDLRTTRATPQRLAVEFAVLVLAVVGVILLRRRGLTASVIQGSADPFMLLVPVLVALTVALAVLRVYPMPLRLAGRFVAARRGPVGFLGLSRAGRDPSGTATPLVVLLVALAFAVFASVVAHSIRVEQEKLSWENVGADIRVDAFEANGFDPVDDVATLAAAAGTSPDRMVGLHRESTASVNELGSSGAEFDLLVLDTADFERFLLTWPVPGPDLDALAEAPDGSADRFPALVSPRFAERVLEDGADEQAVFLPGAEAVLESVGVLGQFPGISPESAWAIARVEDIRRVADIAYWPSVLYLDAPGADVAAVEAAAVELQPFARVTGREATFATTRDAPLAGAVQASFVLTFGLAAGYCALAIMLALVVTSQSRSRNLSYLRTLGLSHRQARGLIAWEIVPMAAITAAVGVVLGVALPRLVGPAIDLRPFTGGAEAAPLGSDLPLVLGLGGGMLVVVVLTTLLVAALNRRLGLGGALRVGEDT